MGGGGGGNFPSHHLQPKLLPFKYFMTKLSRSDTIKEGKSSIFLSYPASCLMMAVPLPEPRMRTDYPACRTRGRARCPAQPGPAAPRDPATATRPDLAAAPGRPCSGATKPRPRPLLMTCGPQPCTGSPGSRSPSSQFCSYQPWTEQ